MPRPVIGPKIRDRRHALGLTQAGLAAHVGISASYLNLIESNKRSIAGALLKRIGDALELPLEELDGAAERRLLSDVGEIAGEPLLAALQLDIGSAADLASRHGAWARALVALHRAWRDRDQVVTALSDRLSQDPFLGDAVHSLLTRAAAIRSSSEILATIGDLEPAEQRRFASIVGAESDRLSDIAHALAAFFDKGGGETRPLMPVEEVDDFLLDRDNHFPTLEEAAGRVRSALRADAAALDERTLVEHLRREHAVGVRDRRARTADGNAQPLAAFDADTRTLLLADTTPPPTRRFELARLAADLHDGGAAVTSVIEASPLLTTGAARRRARRVLSSYVAGAMLLPYEAFHDAAIEARYDVDYLADKFGASFEQVCHRLVTLRRPGVEAIPFGLVRVDAAGFVTKRFPLPHLLLPRHGNACPLWALYAAFQTPGAIVRQLAEFPTGDRFLFVARTVEKPRPAFALPRRFMSIMLACDALHADRTVYADGLDLQSSAPATPVGSNCRLCVRRECFYREQDPIIDA
jgi:predicted transcriptional regulator/transcriptional regulator with XRE-family HTH domain